MHKDAYNTIRNDHVETHVLVSKDLKHMQALVETSELRRAERIRMIQTIPAKYSKTLSKMCCRVQPKQNGNSTNIIVYSILKKGNLEPYLGYSWLQDGNREEIEEWRSKYIYQSILEKYNSCDRIRFIFSLRILRSSTLNFLTRVSCNKLNKAMKRNIDVSD